MSAFYPNRTSAPRAFGCGALSRSLPRQAPSATVQVMLGITLLLMGAAAPPAGPFGVPHELVKPEVAVERVTACGFKSVRSRFDGELQEDVVEVMNVTTASAEQLRCTARASLDSVYYVVFPASIEQTYETLYWRMSRERDKADARVWLEKRGLLARLPTYDPKHSDETAFAHALEALCGPKAAGTLQPMHGMATFKDGALGLPDKGGISPGKLDEETLWCLINASAASGYPLGFIGNEAVQQPLEKR